jgi:activating signal cointegrator 1
MTHDLPEWAISLWQPYASAALDQAIKVHETRKWELPARMVGQRVAIHASKKVVSPAKIDPRADRKSNDVLIPKWRVLLPFGALIGSVVLVDCKCMAGAGGAEPAHELDLIFGDWSPGRFAWRMADPIKFAKPIPYSGLQGFFRIKPEKIAA